MWEEYLREICLIKPHDASPEHGSHNSTSRLLCDIRRLIVPEVVTDPWWFWYDAGRDECRPILRRAQVYVGNIPAHEHEACAQTYQISVLLFLNTALSMRLGLLFFKKLLRSYWLHIFWEIVSWLTVHLEIQCSLVQEIISAHFFTAECSNHSGDSTRYNNAERGCSE